MALTKLTLGGHLEWLCHADEHDYHCNHASTPLQAHMLDEQVQRLQIDTDVYRGMVIVLPQCGCSSQCFLKADYTRKDLLRPNVLLLLRNDAGEPAGGMLAIPHVRNLRLHHMLHQTGKVGIEPILPDLPQELHALREATDVDMLYSLWFTYVLTENRTDIGGFAPYVHALLNAANAGMLDTEQEESQASITL